MKTVDALKILTFLDELRENGFDTAIGTREILLVFEMLYVHASQEERADADSISRLIGPIICTDPASQQRYDRIRREKLDHDPDWLMKTIQEPVKDAALEHRGQTSASKIRSNRKRLWFFALPIVVAAVVCIIGLSPTLRSYMGKWLPGKTSPTGKPTAQPLPTPSPKPNDFDPVPPPKPVIGPTIKPVSPPTKPVKVGFVDVPYDDMKLLTRLRDSLTVSLTNEMERYQHNRRWMWWGGAGLILILTLIWQLYDRLRILHLRTKAGRRPVRRDAQPEQKTIRDAVDSSLGFHALRSKAWALRKRIHHFSARLDLPRTVKATLHRAGYLTPVYRKRGVTPEYLVLIDRESSGDVQARYAAEIVDRLRKGNAAFSVWYFSGDPRICSPAEGSGTSTRLRDLLLRFPTHRLILFTGGAGMIDRYTGQPARWVHDLFRWPVRIIFTPAKTADFGNTEKSLGNTGFLILPSTQKGFEILAQRLLEQPGDNVGGTPIEPEAEPKGATHFPPELYYNTDRWLMTTPTDSVGEIRDVLNRLRSHLGNRTYWLVCASAVYPELRWEIVLYLGKILHDVNGNNLLDEQGLLGLARLPWFRSGYMPDWVREALIGDMAVMDKEAGFEGAETRVSRTRAAIFRMLKSEKESTDPALNLYFPDDADLSTLAAIITARIKSVQHKDREGWLQDAVCVDYLRGKEFSPLEPEIGGLDEGERARKFRKEGRGWLKTVGVWLVAVIVSGSLFRFGLSAKVVRMPSIPFVIHTCDDCGDAPTLGLEDTFEVSAWKVVGAMNAHRSELGSWLPRRIVSLIQVATIGGDSVILWNALTGKKCVTLKQPGPVRFAGILDSSESWDNFPLHDLLVGGILTALDSGKKITYHKKWNTITGDSISSVWDSDEKEWIPDESWNPSEAGGYRYKWSHASPDSSGVAAQIHSFYSRGLGVAVRKLNPRTIVGEDTVTGKRHYSLKHPAEVIGMSVIPELKAILTWDSSGVARLWDGITGDALHRFRHGKSIDGAIPVIPRENSVLTFNEKEENLIVKEMDELFGRRLWIYRDSALFDFGVLGSIELLGHVDFIPESEMVLVWTNDNEGFRVVDLRTATSMRIPPDTLGGDFGGGVSYIRSLGKILFWNSNGVVGLTGISGENVENKSMSISLIDSIPGLTVKDTSRIWSARHIDELDMIFLKSGGINVFLNDRDLSVAKIMVHAPESSIEWDFPDKMGAMYVKPWNSVITWSWSKITIWPVESETPITIHRPNSSPSTINPHSKGGLTYLGELDALLSFEGDSLQLWNGPVPTKRISFAHPGAVDAQLLSSRCLATMSRPDGETVMILQWDVTTGDVTDTLMLSGEFPNLKFFSSLPMSELGYIEDEWEEAPAIFGIDGASVFPVRTQSIWAGGGNQSEWQNEFLHSTLDLYLALHPPVLRTTTPWKDIATILPACGAKSGDRPWARYDSLVTWLNRYIPASDTTFDSGDIHIKVMRFSEDEEQRGAPHWENSKLYFVPNRATYDLPIVVKNTAGRGIDSIAVFLHQDSFPDSVVRGLTDSSGLCTFRFRWLWLQNRDADSARVVVGIEGIGRNDTLVVTHRGRWSTRLDTVVISIDKRPDLPLFLETDTLISDWTPNASSLEDSCIVVYNVHGDTVAKIPRAKADTLTMLSLVNKRIRELESLTGLSNLRTLNLDSNLIRDVTPLQNFESLESLSLKDNVLDFDDFFSLSKLRRLERLDLRGCRIGRSQSSHKTISGFPRLQKLELGGNTVESIHFLSSLKELKVLGLEMNLITDLKPLAGLKNLTILRLDDNFRIKSITPLAELDALKELSIVSVKDAEYLKNLRNLKHLRIHLKPQNLNFLANLGELSHLEIRFISRHGELDLRPVARLEKLQTLEIVGFRGDVQGFDISPLRGLGNLKTLGLQHNQIESIEPLANLINLTSLNLSHNEIDKIAALSRMVRLKTLNLGNNKIKNIDAIQNLVNLTILNINGNSISDLEPLREMSALVELDCGSNRVRDMYPTC